MAYRMLAVLLLVLGLAFLVNAPVVADDKDQTHEVTVVSVTGTKLIMKMDGNEHEHTVAAVLELVADPRLGDIEQPALLGPARNRGQTQ